MVLILEFILEKIDNIWQYEVKGRTDNANIPNNLLEWIDNWFTDVYFDNIFDCNEIILYGEGVGKKIQGGDLFGEQHFKLFDILIGNFWLQPKDIKDLGNKLKLDTPEYWEGTIEDAINSVKRFPKSSFGDFIIEGYVGCPSVGLKFRNGNRIITKIKVKDFVK